MTLVKTIMIIIMVLSLWSCTTMDPHQSLIDQTEKGWIVSTALNTEVK